MLDAFLVPEKTVVTAKGDSAVLDVSGAANSVFLVTLTIDEVIEQESIEINLFTSADGTTWEAKPAATLPQKFYVGEYPLLVNLTATANAKFVRVHWDVNRWGRGANTPRFVCGVRIREVTPEALLEAKSEASTRR
ncbi:MAG: hypothetical protein ABSD63_09915 [Candidatus Korobacteraceae bacterium]|jgi:hypothetical protein